MQWKKNLTKNPKVLYLWSEREREYPKPYIAIVIAISATPDDSSRTFREAAYDCCAYVVGASRHRAQRSCGTAGGQPGLNGIGPQGALPHGLLVVGGSPIPTQTDRLPFCFSGIFRRWEIVATKIVKMVNYDWGSILQ